MSKWTFERTLNGTWLKNSAQTQNVRMCEACIGRTKPNGGSSRCERCNQLLSMIPASTNCDCPPSQKSGGLCFASQSDLPVDTVSLYAIKASDDTQTVESAYFQRNIRAAVAMCEERFSNRTACELLGNLCSLIYGNMDNFGKAGGDACSQYERLRASVGGGRNDWPANMPWLYYQEQDAGQVLTETKITTKFTFNGPAETSNLNFRLAQYSLNGTFLGFTPATGGKLQLCKGSFSEMDSAYQFGTSYSKTCSLSIDELWDRPESDLIFYDMYLEFLTGTIKQLYGVPLKVQNLRGRSNTFINQGTDRRQWQLTRRFFLVDNVSTKTKSTGTNPNSAADSRSKLLRYAKNINMYVQLQDGSKDGQIFPPYIQIEYGELKSNQYGTGATVQASFNVIYISSQTQFNYDLSVAMGVLCSLAAVYAAMRTWGWSRRAGKIAVDFVSIVKVVAYACGAIANIFLIVTFGAAFWFIIFYKRQNVVFLFIPTVVQELPFVVYLSVGFGLKCLEMIHLFASQCTIDIFFIDWERPKGRVVTMGEGEEKTKENPVSIWRTYFIANEWNEIQTHRKIRPIFQLMAVIFFLKVVGFEYLASADPQSLFYIPTDGYRAPDSRIFRYAIATCIFFVVALCQYLFFTFFYERFIEDKVQNYVDLCSMSNVSVFIMANAQFGYYIHGRSVHGLADTGLKEMHDALHREEQDLVGHRGLVPNTDQQTFQMALPRKLRVQYDRVLMPLTERGSGQANRMERGQGGNAALVKSLQAYNLVTKFLSAFIDHALKDLDYIVKDKLLLESILDLEFEEVTEKGAFYNDDGHSFDHVLFYGNESTLLTFDIFLFCVVDLISQNFILAAIITYLIDQLLVLVRDSLGKKNLARKTLVDERFLI
ncbi:meckelin-like isoform X2 [Tubulanus polymorphus]|uniref:meckelin-like isoform X2 n=1 Tax=Tubulanus polymorphus TaxID=672921 RepID=UPI003DA664C3